ncbi:MAG: YqgE/AlgH family protein [Burkholderiales bacterium]|nr:YqgE/AlgH family protein [Burkholderiales bacterium]
MGTRRRLLALLALAATAGAGARRAAAQGAAPAAGLLVATPALVGSMFEKSVVLFTRTPADDTIGVILNQRRAADWPAELGTPDAPGRMAGIYRGGPLAPQALFMVREAGAAADGVLPLGEDLWFAAGAGAIRRLLAVPGGGRSKLFRGYAGWAPGQLGAEVARGAWNMQRLDPGVVFDDAPDGQWERLQAPRRVA